jgi:hypothetical protein
MPSSGLCRRVVLVRADVSEERATSIFRYREDGGDTFIRNVGSQLHGATSQKTAIFSHRRENLKSYKESRILCVVPRRLVPYYCNFHLSRRVKQSAVFPMTS